MCGRAATGRGQQLAGPAASWAAALCELPRTARSMAACPAGASDARHTLCAAAQAPGGGRRQPAYVEAGCCCAGACLAASQPPAYCMAGNVNSCMHARMHARMCACMHACIASACMHRLHTRMHVASSRHAAGTGGSRGGAGQPCMWVAVRGSGVGGSGGRCRRVRMGAPLCVCVCAGGKPWEHCMHYMHGLGMGGDGRRVTQGSAFLVAPTLTCCAHMGMHAMIIQAPDIARPDPRHYCFGQGPVARFFSPSSLTPGQASHALPRSAWDRIQKSQDNRTDVCGRHLGDIYETSYSCRSGRHFGRDRGHRHFPWAEKRTISCEACTGAALPVTYTRRPLVRQETCDLYIHPAKTPNSHGTQVPQTTLSLPTVGSARNAGSAQLTQLAGRYQSGAPAGT